MLEAKDALRKLKDGNKAYLNAMTGTGDISPELRRKTAIEGQQPYAIIVACSDSRVIPESIFSAGLGELFVIRVAGNVLDRHQLGSIEYAAQHLGTRLIVVLGHTHCGAIGAAIEGASGGLIDYVVNDIRTAIGEEKDDLAACRLNALHSAQLIRAAFPADESDSGLTVAAAIYHIEDGTVEFPD